MGVKSILTKNKNLKNKKVNKITEKDEGFIEYDLKNDKKIIVKKSKEFFKDTNKGNFRIRSKRFFLTYPKLPDLIDLKDANDVQHLPCAFGTFCIIYNGEIISHHPISNTRFENIMKKKIKQNH